MKKKEQCSKKLRLRFRRNRIMFIMNVILVSSFIVCGQAVSASTMHSQQGITNADIVVSGQVTDGKGTGIPGVSIKLQNSTTAATTDNAGRFTIKVPENGVLVFSYVGYVTSEQQINGRKSIKVTLLENNQALSEVIVVGYGTQKKAVVSGAVTAVKGSELAKTPSANL
jgi:archaellum component FlaF (FlaF/FlaG flagellin family)